MKNILCIFSLVLGMFSVSCTSLSGKKGEDVIYMGVILPFYENPQLAVSMCNAMNLAVADVNASPDKMAGKELKLKIYSDGKSEAQTGKLLVEMLESKEEILHIALREPVVYFRDTLAESSKLINYLNDYAPVTLQGANSVRMYIGASQICEEMAKVVDKKLLEEKGELRVVAIGTEDLMTRSAVAYLKYELGSPKIKFYDEYFRKGETHFDILAEHLTSLGADYIFVFSSGAENASIFNALKKSGFDGQVVFGSKQRGGQMSTGSYVLIEPEFASQLNETYRAFVGRYREAYGKAMYGAEVAFAYDSIILSAKAYNENRENLREFFLSKSVDGIVGTMQFDSTGDSKIKLKSDLHLLE